MKKNITCLYFSLVVIIVVASCNVEESTKSEFEDIYRNQIDNYIVNESVKLCDVSLQKGIDSINTYF